MDIYKLYRQFWDYCFNNPEKIKPTHIAIYSYAIEHCNRLGWKAKFGFPTSLVMEATGIKSYSVYKKHLDDLCDFGFINMIELSKNQHSSNIIALKENAKAPIKALDKALVKHLSEHPLGTCESTCQSTVSIDIPITNTTNLLINNDTNLHDSPSPSINLYSEIFKNLEPDFAKEIQSCINGRMPIFLKKEIAGKKNTYFQLLKNLPSFQQTIKHQAKPLETNEAFENRIDLLIKNWLQEQRDGKIEQSWTNLSDFAQHALNYIRLQENKSKNGNNGNSQQNARPSKGFVETKDNDYNNLGWGKPLGH